MRQLTGEYASPNRGTYDGDKAKGVMYLTLCWENLGTGEPWNSVLTGSKVLRPRKDQSVIRLSASASKMRMLR